MANSTVTMEVGDDGVAIITMNHPPVNSINYDVMIGVYSSFKEAHRRTDVKAIVLTGAAGKFCGGFDIRTMQLKEAGGAEAAKTVKPDFRGHEMMNAVIEGGPKSAVAAIETFALGGGLEFAMGCHARLATPKTTLGLPELQLGIIPGLGGTQRLPRLVGLEKALDMMLMAKLISSDEALKSGLVDAVVTPERLIVEARRWALDIAAGRKPWHRSLNRTDHLGSIELSLKVINDARVKAKKLFRNVPHPSGCLEAVEEGISKGPIAGTILEEKISGVLKTTPSAAGMMHAFFAERAAAKVPGVTDQGFIARPMQSAAVVGVGLMGSGIATALVLQQIPVILKEVDAKALDCGMKLIKANLESLVKRGALKQEKLQSILTLMKGTLDYRDLGNVDIVIEAVVENAEVKQKIFQDLERYCKPDCILATNTSAIDLNIVGKLTRSQDRIAGTHFFSPAHLMPLLELVKSEHTSLQVQLNLMKFTSTLKKVPIMVKSSSGFAVNRVFFPYFMSANFLVINLGIHPYRIDSILSNFGMPMGPFRMNDMAGIQISVAVASGWYAMYPDRVFRLKDGVSLARVLSENNRLGEKTGKGYYNYVPGSRKEQPAPEIVEIISETRRRAGLDPYLKEFPLSDKEVLEMVLFPVVNEACRVLEERVVLRASDLDLATIMGMGFPRYRGGIVFWGDSIGVEHIHSQLNKWADLYRSMSMESFFKPCRSLEKVIAAKNSVVRVIAARSSLAKIQELSPALL